MKEWQYRIKLRENAQQLANHAEGGSLSACHLFLSLINQLRLRWEEQKEEEMKDGEDNGNRAVSQVGSEKEEEEESSGKSIETTG